jgi:hypothetical protein
MKKIYLLIFGMFFLVAFVSASFGYGGLSDSAKVENNVYVVNGSILSHNNLSGLQGGTSNEYYHISQAWYNELLTNLFNFLTQSDTDLLYAGIEWDYNQTIPAQTYADAQDIIFNNSMKGYADAQDIIFNNSMKGYADAQDTFYNDSIISYVDSLPIQSFWNKTGDNIYYTDGNVGIGTTSPSATLDVAGDIKSLDWSNVSITENQISDFGVYTNQSYVDGVNTTQMSYIELTFLKIADMFSKANIISMISGNRSEIEANTNSAILGNRSEIEANTNSAILGNRSEIEANTNSAILGNRSELQSSINANISSWTSTYNATYDNLLSNKTSYWSCTGVNFVPNDYNDYYDRDAAGEGTFFYTSDVFASVELPHGVFVQDFALYGERAGGSSTTATLKRYALSNESTSTMASLSSYNSNDSSIDYSQIDNSQYGYYINVISNGEEDSIYGARIKYTTYYD